jgi:hypothetical protein
MPFCKCGCGEKCRLNYVNGHSLRVHPFSKEQRLKGLKTRGKLIKERGYLHSKEVRKGMSVKRKGIINQGEKHPYWRGNDVKYTALHQYFYKRISKPDRCPNCNKKRKLDLSNISNEYTRDISDWEWICRSCHMLKDFETKRKINKQRLAPNEAQKVKRWEE